MDVIERIYDGSMVKFEMEYHDTHTSMIQVDGVREILV